MRLLRLLTLLVLGLPSVAWAQVIRGRIVDALGQAPIPGALVELQDSIGRALQRTLASPSGAFRFVPPARGSYRIRVAAIGYSIHPVQLITLRDADAILPDLRLEAAATILPDVVAAGKRQVCGREILEDPLLGRLLEAGRTSLTLIEATLALGNRYAVREVVTRTEGSGRAATVRVDSTERLLAAWPLQSIDPRVLERDGFSRLLAPEEGVGRVYHGPDLRVLFADWFLNAHCFSFARAPADESAGIIRVRYEPRAKTGRVDVAGELVLDATTLALREFSFVHRNLPAHIRDGDAGGMIAFAQQASGAWLPVRWQLRAPIELATMPVTGARDGLLGRTPRPTIRPAVTGQVSLVGTIAAVPGSP
jgi:hypothetical protein